SSSVDLTVSRPGCRSYPKRQPPLTTMQPGRPWTETATGHGSSGWWTPLTAPRSSSRATASSRSTSRWCRKASRCWGWSLLPRWTGFSPPTARTEPAEGATVVSSRSHGDADALARFTERRRIAAHLHAGSSLKFCLLAAGQADLYPRFGRTMEWDTAAGDAVLRAAGGRVTDLQGQDLRYGKPGFENPHFVAWGREAAGTPGVDAPAVRT